MPTNLVDGQFGHGAVKSNPEALAALRVVPRMGATAPVDFVKGFDIRNILGGDIAVKNQYQSMSCVGQGFSYYEWVQHVLIEMATKGMDLTQLRASTEGGAAPSVNVFSAKAIYSQVSLGFGQGATFIDAANLAKNWGALYDLDCPSNLPDGTTTETFMTDKTWETPATTAFAELLQIKEFALLDANADINDFAAAILANNGVVGGVTGSDGHGWGSAQSPTPPNPGDTLWGHCLFYGAFGTDEDGIFVATPNSWGQITALPNGAWQPGYPPGYGWQKLRPNYFTPQWTFEPFTLVDKVNS